MTANFESVLDAPSESIERPKPLPRGTYLTVVTGQPAQTKVGKDQTEAWDFSLKVLQPGPDVDQEALRLYGDVAGKSIRARFFITPDAAYRLRDFLKDHLGIDSNGKTMRQMMAEAPGRSVYATVDLQPSQDGTQMYTNLKNTAKV